ncbi:MAG: hypothetical protein IMF07_03700 [Proteobacteria bacterium]|nr:hypothetical protein [Pseudomonadota bacterium]
MPAKEINSSGDAYKQTLAFETLLKACQLKKQGDYNQAFIEGVSSLELAISEHCKESLDLPKGLKEEMERFWHLPTYSQLVAISSSMENLPYDDVSMAIEAIEISNKIIDEGLDLTFDFELKKKLDALFSITSKLLSDKPINLDNLVHS